MDTVADVARAILAVVFTVAAVGKLLDLPSARRTMAAFGLPPRMAASAGTALPFAELATVVLVVLEPTARVGGVAALALMVAFIAGISVNLAQGNTPDCNCFGQLSAKPISWRTLARNAVLAALAVLVVANGAGGSLLRWMSADTAETIAALLVLVAIGAVIAGRQMRRDNVDLEAAYRRVSIQLGALPLGLPVGLRAPAFELPDLDGNTVTLDSLCARGRPVMLLFVSPDCGPCIRLLPELRRWDRALRDRLTFAVISNGSGGGERDHIVSQLHDAGDFTILVQEGIEVANQYRVLATPTALVIAPDGRVASGSAGGPDEIEALVRIALEPAPQQVAVAGQPV